jgi:DNA-directed RNA polymerase subunit RPC12/RpoP
MPAEARVRKSDPHRCPECAAAFEVSYFDDRSDARAELPMATAEATCPACGHARPVSLPAGAERTLLVELSDGVEADEGGGG